MRYARGLTLVIAAAVLTAASRAEAATITFNDEVFTSGAGIGTVPVILVVQEDPDEAGSIYWDGTEDVETDDAKPQSQTWSVSSLADIGITGSDPFFGLVLNLNESASGESGSLDLLALQMDFFDGAGALLFSAPYLCDACIYSLPLTLDETGQGTGSSGFLFDVNLTAEERMLFFGSPSNRLGLFASILNSSGGQETFYLADLGTNIPEQPLAPVPEPASMLLLGTGLVSLGVMARRKKRAQA